LSQKQKVDDFKKLANEDLELLLLEKYFCDLLGGTENEDISKYYYDVINRPADNDVTATIYDFSNERLRNLFSSFDLKGKRIATVGSSGDQALYAIFCGCKNIDLIDQNPFTKVWVDLKVAAIKALDHDEFVCFANNTCRMFTKKEFSWMYRKISHFLPPKSQRFWDEIFLNVPENQYMLDNLFFCDFSPYRCEFYDKAKDYLKLKHLLFESDFKINFIMAELNEFPQKLHGKYDLILLSNIVSYCHNQKQTEFCEIVKILYDNFLNAGGFVQVSSSRDTLLSNNAVLTFIEENNFPTIYISNSGLACAPSTLLEKPKNISLSNPENKIIE